MIKYFCLFVVVAFVHGSNAQLAQCDMLNDSLIDPPDLQELQGTWYKLASSPYEVTPMLPCERLNADYVADNDTLIGTAFHYVDRYSPEYIDWTQLITQEPSGALSVHTLSPPGVENRYYRIISDYRHYAIIYTCIWVEGQYGGRTIWVAGRTREFNQRNFNKAIAKLTEVGVAPQEWTMNYSREC